jgi:steroid delta-isomerase-like uncharacterized protein
MGPNQVLQRWFQEVWNEGSDSAVDALLAPHAVAHGLGKRGEVCKGPAEFRVFFRQIRATFPDAKVQVKDSIEQGDRGCACFEFEGTHLGDGLGVPPTGQRVAFSGIVFVRVENGKIVEASNGWDQLGMLQQVGILPNAPGA